MAIPTMWRNKKQRYSMDGVVCLECENAIFPPRPVCPHCRKEKGLHAQLQETQSLYTMPVSADSFDARQLQDQLLEPVPA